MAETGIEWATRIWSVVSGCTPVSAGCQRCWGRAMLRRMRRDPHLVVCHADKLNEPFSWRGRQRAFVAPLGDLFHADVPDEFRDRMFAVMAITPRSTYLLLTKRADLAMKYLAVSDLSTRIMTAFRPIEEQLTNEQWLIAGGWGATNMMPWPLPNVWLGVSVEDQVTADERIPLLLETPAALHFASYEPALEAVDFSPWLLPQPGRPGLGWLIAGGESGAGARPCDPAWIAAAVAQCRQAGVPAFTKQFGTAWARVNLGRRTRAGDPAEWPPGDWPREVPEVYG